MNSSKGNSSNIKRKKKMTKAQLQLAIIKKRELDAKAQTIVERLLEPDIDSEWLLENLIHLNKCHMEDVIEERSIEKMCGYALCKNVLTKVIHQQYRISTVTNKVYDISQRKKFCSSFCYCAANYLLEQMLTSPLWLRENENIPEFQLLSENKQNNIPGEEVIYKHTIDPKEPDQSVQNNFPEETKIETSTELPAAGKVKTKSVSFQLPIDEKQNPVCSQNSDEACVSFISPIIVGNIVGNIMENDKLTSSSNATKTSQRKESKFQKERKSSKTCYNNVDSIGSLVKRIENVFREWTTEDTLRLLFGKEIDKEQIFENVEKHEKYAKLCQKLNKLQIDEENEEPEILANRASNPVPDYSALQGEGKELQLKVRAYLKGSIINDDQEVCTKSNSEEQEVGPLVDSQAPNAIRRKIFTNKINSVLQDLLQCCPALHAYSNERDRMIKALVSTFALTSENVVFKSVEWNLVGLIIIKMLSLFDSQLKNLINTKDSARFVSMILMSYQLNTDYLDTFISCLR